MTDLPQVPENWPGREMHQAHPVDPPGAKSICDFPVPRHLLKEAADELRARIEVRGEDAPRPDPAAQRDDTDLLWRIWEIATYCRDKVESCKAIAEMVEKAWEPVRGAAQPDTRKLRETVLDFFRQKEYDPADWGSGSDSCSQPYFAPVEGAIKALDAYVAALRGAAQPTAPPDATTNDPALLLAWERFCDAKNENKSNFQALAAALRGAAQPTGEPDLRSSSLIAEALIAAQAEHSRQIEHFAADPKSLRPTVITAVLRVFESLRGAAQPTAECSPSHPCKPDCDGIHRGAPPAGPSPEAPPANTEGL